MGPGNFIKDPISAISFGMALMFGTAGLPHILMRFFTVPERAEARKSVLWATGWIGYFYMLTFIIGFGAIVMVATDPGFLDPAGGLRGGGNMAAIHLADAIGGNLFLGFVSRRRLRDDPRGRRRADAVGRLGGQSTTSTPRSSARAQADQARRAARLAAGPCWCSPRSRSCSASCSRSRMSPSWSAWPSRWPRRAISRCC